MNENSEANEIIRLYIVDDDGKEVGIDQYSCVKLEITNAEDACYGLEESEYIKLAADNTAIEDDSSLLDNNLQDPKSESGNLHEMLNLSDDTTLVENFELSDEENDVPQQNPKFQRRGRTDASRNEDNYQRKMHTCEVCGYSAHKISHYKRHLGIHIKPDSLICGICKRSMENNSALSAHKEEHRCLNDLNKFRCNLCDYTSDRFSNVIYHTDVHYKLRRGELTCGSCSFTTTNKVQFRKHMALHSKVDKKCPVCLREFKTVSLRQKHMERYKSSNDSSKYQCPECSYSTTRFNSFKQHLVIHQTDLVEMAQCPHCPFKTKRKTDLKQHVLVKHKRDDEVVKLQCDFCTYQSRRACHLTNHMKNMHRSELTVKKCGFCSFKTVSQVIIEKHFTIHSKIPDTFFICSLCGFGCESQNLLEEHMEVNHDDADEMNEEESVEENTTEMIELEEVKIEMKSENEESEENIDEYYCQFPLCKIVSKTEIDAKIHRTVCHDETGDDHCPECTFHTKSRYLYLDHLKVHGHNIEQFKTHLCDICGSKWLREVDLLKHMSIHQKMDTVKRKKSRSKVQEKTNKKNLSCMFCSYKSRMRLCLYKHMIKHGREHQQNFMSYLKDNEESL